MSTRISTTILSLGVAAASLAGAASATARPLTHVSTGRDVCRHGPRTVWHVAYESFGAVAFHDLDHSVTRQSTPGGGRPDAALRAALQRTADLFGNASRCTVGLRFDVYWAPHTRLTVRQENYARLTAANLPRPTPAPGGPRRATQFFSRYDSVMEQFSATRPDGSSLLGYNFEGETFGYVSLLDTLSPDPQAVTYELLQGMVRFFWNRGARVAPNPGSAMDAYCSTLHKLGYTDVRQSSNITCTSNHYASDVIGGRVPVYHGITGGLWRRYSVSRSWRRHHTVPAGLPAGHGRITTGAGPH